MTYSEDLALRVGDNVRKLRRAKNWTQADLVMVTGRLGVPMSRAKLARMEAGTGAAIKLADAHALASALFVSIYDLIANTTDERQIP